MKAYVWRVTFAAGMLFGFTNMALAQAGPFTTGIDGTVTPTENSHLTASPANASPCVTTGTLASTQGCLLDDLSGNSSERGPINSNTTKIGVINTAPIPMLGDTNPNGNTDLDFVLTQTAKDTNTGDLWYYFGWKKDTAGTGFVAIEFQHSAATAACQADPVGATCNPWANRRGGTNKPDFVIMWDQSGTSTDIIKRNFLCTSGVSQCTGSDVYLAPCPNVITSTSVTDACHRINPADAEAAFGQPPLRKQDTNDPSRGELAINLSTQIFSAGVCESFANIIPGTVTGNSDTADYKDVVLQKFPSIKNCGEVSITKQTDPAQLAGTFTYTLTTSPSGSIFSTVNNVVQKDSDCGTGSDASQCKGTLITTTADPDSYTSDTDVISDLLENDTNWTLTEDANADFDVKTVTCTQGSNVYHLIVNGAAGPDSKFKVVAGETTVCVIVNKPKQTTPGSSTTQSTQHQVKDSISLSGIKANAPDASSAKVSFYLYTASDCKGTPVAAAENISLTYANSGTTATAAMPSFTGNVAASTKYYWQVSYSGDTFNTPFSTTCGEENVQISVAIDVP